MLQGKQHTRHFVLYSFGCYVPYAQYGCGVLFICSKVFQNLHSDRLIDSTLSFYTNLSRGQDSVILSIMKKAFSTLGAFCLGAFITIGVMACADDYSDGKTSTENEFGGAGGSLGSDSSTDGELEATVVEVKRKWSHGPYCDYDFIYDKAGRIVQVRYEDYYYESGPQYENFSFDVTYSDKTISYERYIDGERDVTEITLNNDIYKCSIDDINDCIVDVIFAEIEY